LGQVRIIGDINGDGFDDIAVAPNFIIFGGNAPRPLNFEITDIDGSNGFVVKSTAILDIDELRSLGDINNDGFDDFFVFDDDSGSEEHRVIFGKASWPANVDIDLLLPLGVTQNSNGFVTDNSLFPIGDINKDQVDDFASYEAVYFGDGSIAQTFANARNGINGFRLVPNANGFPDIVDLLVPVRLTSAGDFNGDGLNDLLVVGIKFNASQDARIHSYIIYGSQGVWPVLFDFDFIDGINGLEIMESTQRAAFAFSSATAGDFNDDGYADLILGSPDAEAEAGSVSLVFGAANPDFSIVVDQVTSLESFNFDGGESFGFKVTPAGDFNQDGYDDFFVTAPFAGFVDAGNLYMGYIYLIYGAPATSWQKQMSMFDISDFGKSLSFGFANTFDVSTGDINGDGLMDFVTGGGVSYVVFGCRKTDAGCPF